MDASNEKKWFVYIGDKHEGPFSLEEVQGKMSQGLVSPSTYVWAEGMQDWKVMNEVAAFAPLIKSGDSHARQASAMQIAPGGEDTGKLDPKEAKKAAKQAEKEAKAEAKRQAKLAKAQGSGDAASGVQVVGGERVAPKLIRWGIILLIPVGLVAGAMGGMFDPLMENPAIKAAMDSASDTVRPYLLTVSEKLPFLKPYISPIPRLEDVSPDDYQELQNAAREEEGAGPKYAIALNTGDLLAPTFYVATTAGDGKQFRLVVTGVGDTLLNHTSFEGSAPVIIDKQLGKSTPIRFPDGKPLPRGDYIVSLQDLVPANPPGQAPGAPAPPAKTYAKKQYFLGGPKDATYASRLREFHDRLKAKAAAELAEIKQFAATLDTQLSSTTAAFNKFRGKAVKGKAPKLTRAQLKGWNDLHAKWAQLDGQLSQTFQKWTPDTIAKDYYYYRLYQLTHEAGQAITSLHGLQHSYMTGAANMAQFDADLVQSQNLAQSSLDLLKAKIDQAEKLPPSPRGLPRREGL